MGNEQERYAPLSRVSYPVIAHIPSASQERCASPGRLSHPMVAHISSANFNNTARQSVNQVHIGGSVCQIDTFADIDGTLDLEQNVANRFQKLPSHGSIVASAANVPQEPTQGPGLGPRFPRGPERFFYDKNSYTGMHKHRLASRRAK